MLDPIDGTKSFISGMPAWGTLIALTRFGEPVFGMMNQPFIARALQRRRRRRALPRPGRRRATCGCAPARRLSDAVLFTTSPLLMNAADRSAFGKVEDAVRLSRYGGDCYAYCMLAAGHVDLVIETELKPYDVLPLVPIIAGAGGIVTTWENGPPHAGGRIVAAGDKRVHAAALALLGIRRSHPNSGVPGTKASNAASTCMRKRSCSISSSWRAPGTMRCEPARSRTANSSIAGVETIWSCPAATTSIGWRILPG